jgi:hypothetical protein
VTDPSGGLLPGRPTAFSADPPESPSYGLGKILLLTSLLKVGTLLAAAAGFGLFAFQAQNFIANFHYPAAGRIGIQDAFQTWDAQHYLYLAREGYGPGCMSNAFFPLYPWLIRGAGLALGGRFLAAALVVSNLLGTAAMAYLFLLVRPFGGPRAAFFSCLFLAAFPTAFYMSLPYSESLFLFLCLGFLFHARQGRTGWASAFAFLLPLSRPMGLLACLAVAADAWAGRKGKGVLKANRLVLAAAFAAGAGAYLAFMKQATGDPMSGLKAQAFFASGYLQGGILRPWEWISRNFIHLHYSLNGVGDSLLNRLGFLAFLAGMAAASRRLPPAWAALGWVLGLAPASSGDLMSYIRYLDVVFPLFIYAADRMKLRPWYYLAACLPLQLLLLLRHTLGFWVG